MPRMRILSAAEQARLELPPIFDSAERKRYLDFSQSLMETARTLRGPDNQIGFLLMCGYFRAARQFFSPTDFHARDIAYVARLLDLPVDTFSSKRYVKATRFRHQQLILDFYGFRSFDGRAKTQLVTEIATMARGHLKPRLIFGRGLDFLIESRVQVPSVRRLTDLIRTQLNTRKRELVRLAKAHLTPPVRRMLDDLFIQDSGENRYRLTLLKKLSQSTRPGKIKEGCADFQTLSELYRQITPILVALDLGPEGIRYHAGSVLKSRVFQLQQRADADRHLHAAAFIAHQHNRSQDALIDMLLSVIQSFEAAAARDHKDQVFERRKTEDARIDSLLDAIDTEVFGALREIRCLVEDERLSDVQKLGQIKVVLARDREHEFAALRADIREEAGKNVQFYQALESRSLRLQNRITPILRVVRFEGNARTANLMSAITYFQDKGGVIGQGAPLDFLEPDERQAVSDDDGGFRTSLYKVFLFRHVAGAIKAGNLNLDGSYKYRPLDDYLISRERWNREKRQLLERAGLAEFADPEPVLRALDTALHQQYEITNRNAREGANPYLKIAANRSFRIATPALEDVESEPLRNSFPARHYVPLPEILATVNQHCGLLEELQHWQQTHSHQPPSPAVMFAGIMGLGCGIGVQKMARISPSVTERELEHVVNWRFSLDNIIAANDRVVGAMDRMELPNIYRKTPAKLHTASDGQKFEVRAESLNASYSFKYFGKGQGVSAYTFIDERNLLWHSLVFSAAERESAYVIDGLMHNDVVQSDIHSTDEHGYNEAIFGITHLLGLAYAPRIKNLKKQQLYQFHARRGAGADWVIAPDKYVNEALIRENWDEFLRLVTTIKLKETTASDIFRRLNSYSRQHSLYRTMKAFGQIIKSLFGVVTS